MPKLWFKLRFSDKDALKLNFISLHKRTPNHIFPDLGPLWVTVPSLACRNASSQRQLVNPASFVLLGNQRLLGLEPLSAVVNSEWWLSSLTKRKSSCIVLAWSVVYKNLSPVDGLCLIQFSFVCKSLVLFVFFDFLVVLFSLSPSRVVRDPSSLFASLQLGFITRILPHPLISDKHIGYVYQSRDK